MPESKVHEINVKGYCNRKFFDTQTERSYHDVVWGNGKIFFTGTESELDVYLDWLVTNEGKLGFKII